MQAAALASGAYGQVLGSQDTRYGADRGYDASVESARIRAAAQPGIGQTIVGGLFGAAGGLLGNKALFGG